MNLSVSKNANINYLAKIIKIENIRKHSNADKLQIVTIDGANIIVGLNVKIGDLFIYCPTESCLNPMYLASNNLYEDKTLNVNKEIKGYVNNKGRVRAIKLRGEISRALLMPISSLKEWRPEIDIFNIEDLVNIEFDTIDDIKFNWKYVVQIQKNLDKKNQQNKINKFKKIIDNQFRFHIDTPQFMKNVEKLKPDSYIQITSKLHGTSGIAAYVQVNKKIGFLKKWLYRILGEKPVEYDYIASSRSVVRNDKKQNDGFYKSDIWSYCLNYLKPYLSKGMTVYYEIVGYIPDTGKAIQKGYDYGCKNNECEIYVYRITNTNVDGEVFEYSSQQVKEWCKSHGIKSVPELYYGTLQYFLYTDRLLEYDKEDLIKELSQYEFMESNDPMCKNKVPYEGIVIRVDNWKDIEAYKLKAEAFYQHETKQLDNAENDMHEEE